MLLGYLDDPVDEYLKVVDSAISFADLARRLKPYRLIANDAYLLALKASEDDFEFFKKGLVSERKKKFAGDNWAEKYSIILFPRVMFEASVLADHFMVPFGLAFNRLKDVRAIKVTNGIGEWVERENNG